MELISILCDHFFVQDNSKLMEEARAVLRTKRTARLSPWIWTFGYLGCILILFALGPGPFIMAGLFMHLVFFLHKMKRTLELRREEIKTRFSRH